MQTRHLALAGLIGPPLFAALVVLVTALEWDYLHDLGWSAGPFDSPDTPWPSSAGLGDSGFVLVVAFLVLAASVLALALAMYRILGRKLAPGLLSVLASGIAAAAVKTDSSSAGGGGPEEWNGVVHAAGFTVLVFAAIPAMLVLGAQFRPLRRVSLFAAVLALAALVAFLAGGGNVFFWAFLALLLGWLSGLAARVWWIASPQPRA